MPPVFALLVLAPDEPPERRATFRALQQRILHAAPELEGLLVVEVLESGGVPFPAGRLTHVVASSLSHVHAKLDARELSLRDLSGAQLVTHAFFNDLRSACVRARCVDASALPAVEDEHLLMPRHTAVRLLSNRAERLSREGKGERAECFREASWQLRLRCPYELDGPAKLASLAALKLPCLHRTDAPFLHLCIKLGCPELAAPDALGPPAAARRDPLPVRSASAAAVESLCPFLTLSDDLLASILSRLPRTSLLRALASCKRLASLGGRLGAVAPLRIVTFNAKNNGENRFTGQPRGEGCRAWAFRCPVLADSLATLRPTVVGLQEDDAGMRRDLFATKALHSTGLRAFPPAPGPGTPPRSRVILGEAEARDEKAVSGRPAWEQGSILYDSNLLELVQGGGFAWVDGRGVCTCAFTERAECEHCLSLRAAGPRAENRMVVKVNHHLIPCTWTLLRWKAAPPLPPATAAALREPLSVPVIREGAGYPTGPAAALDSIGCFLVLNTHLEAGHNHLADIPAKKRSLTLIRESRDRLLAWFGPGLPYFITGDFNAQKVQGYHKDFMGKNGMDKSAIGRERMLDVFDALAQDSRHARCPIGLRAHDNVTTDRFVRATLNERGCSTDARAGVRTGGCNGTTWHDFVGTWGAERVSDAMALQCQHRTDAEGLTGAVGHQRHIDHILLPEVASLSGRVRVSQAWVETSACRRKGHCPAEPGREPSYGKPPAEWRKRGKGEEHEREPCCAEHGCWASDHFPVAADLWLFFTPDDDAA